MSSKETQLEAAQAEIDVAAAAVNEAQAELDALAGNIANAKTVVAEAKAEVEKAETAVVDQENLTEEESSNIEEAQKALSDAEDTLADLQDPKYEQTLKDAVSSAEASYRQAQAAYNSTSESADEAIASAKDALDTANLGSDSSDNATEAQIRSLQEAIDGESLKSPVSGTVTAVNVAQDGTYTGGAVVTIQDTESLYVEAGIKEADIPDIKEGMEVLVKTEATGDKELTGKVTFVAPTAGTGTSAVTNDTESLTSAVASSGSSNTYLIEIDLLEKNERLRIDMTAKISLIKEQKKNVLVVPTDALFMDENGNRTLHVVSSGDVSETDGLSAANESMGVDTGVLDENAYTEVQVETGMESGHYVEILPTAGVENGTIIMLPSGGDSSLDAMDPAGGLG